MEEGSDFAAAVNKGRFIQGFWDAFNKLHNQENKEGTGGKCGDYQGQEAVEPAKFLEHNILGNHQHLGRQKHCYHHTGKPEASPLKTDPCKAIGYNRRGADLSNYR